MKGYALSLGKSWWSVAKVAESGEWKVSVEAPVPAAILKARRRRRHVSGDSIMREAATDAKQRQDFPFNPPL